MSSNLVSEMRSKGLRERKAEATRQGLLAAARLRMSEGGVAAITIQTLTEMADIAHATFYNYFSSREEVINAVIVGEASSLASRLEFLIGDLDDVAERYCVSTRHLMHMAVTDRVWGGLVVQLGMTQEGLIAALAPRAKRDLELGIQSGRFKVADAGIATAMTFGALLSAMHEYLLSNRRDDPSQGCAEQLLRMVGINPDEAHELAYKPLPELPSR